MASPSNTAPWPWLQSSEFSLPDPALADTGITDPTAGSLSSATTTSNPTVRITGLPTATPPPVLQQQVNSGQLQYPPTILGALGGIGDVLSGAAAGARGDPGYIQRKIASMAAIKEAQDRTDLARFSIIPHVLDSFDKILAKTDTPEGRSALAASYGDILGRLGVAGSGDLAKRLSETPGELSTLISTYPELAKQPVAVQKYFLAHPEHVQKFLDQSHVDAGNKQAAQVYIGLQDGSIKQADLSPDKLLGKYPEILNASDEWKLRLGIDTKNVMEKKAEAQAAPKEVAVGPERNALAIEKGYKDFQSAPQTLQKQINDTIRQRGEDALDIQKQRAAIAEGNAALAQQRAAMAQEKAAMEANQPAQNITTADAQTQLSALKARGASSEYLDAVANQMGFKVVGQEPQTTGIGQKIGSALGITEPPKTIQIAPLTRAERGSGGTKPLTKTLAAEILKDAGGDKDKAREMARKLGYSF